MYPIYTIEGIEKQEKKIEGSHVIALLLVKPSDNNAEEYLRKFNYYHHRSEKYCSIYLLGYSKGFLGKYTDVMSVQGYDNQKWEYSDCCFIETCDELKKRIKKWDYSGEPEMIILQNSSASNPRHFLDFSNYVWIEIEYGISKGYIDSFPRFMERFVRACKSEVTAENAILKEEFFRIKPKRIIENSLEMVPKLPGEVKVILNDGLFFKSCKG